jgi:hypothetical protein
VLSAEMQYWKLCTQRVRACVQKWKERRRDDAVSAPLRGVRLAQSYRCKDFGRGHLSVESREDMNPGAAR